MEQYLIEFSEFKEFRESEKSLKLDSGSVQQSALSLYLCGTVVSSLSLGQEVLGSNTVVFLSNSKKTHRKLQCFRAAVGKEQP